MIRWNTDIPGENIIIRKPSEASVNAAEDSELLSEGFRGKSPLRKCLDSKEHLDWLEIDLNVAKIRTVQDYAPKINMSGSTHM